MKRKLTPRWFGQMAIAGTAAVGLKYLTNKTFAQTPNLLLYGARPDAKAGVILVQLLNVTNGVLEDVTRATLTIGEQLIGSLP